MQTSLRNALSSIAAAAFITLSLAATPVLADKGGNGGGNGNGNSGGNGASNSNGNGGTKSTSHGNSATAPGKTKVAAASAAAKGSASAYGKLNGFLHAPPKVLANASPKSAIGKVAKVCAGLLNACLNPVEGETAPTAADVAAALKAAANKPLGADIIAKVNTKLLATNSALADSLTASGKTASGLATEIAAAMEEPRAGSPLSHGSNRKSVVSLVI